MKDSKTEGLKKRIKADMIFTIIVAVVMLVVMISNFVSYFTYDGIHSEMLSGAIQSLVTCGGLIAISLIMVDIFRKGKPFSKSIIVKLRVLAVWIIVGAFLPNVVTFIVEILTIQEAEFSMGGRDAFVAILGVIIGIVSEIFHYGYELQEDMDSIA